MSTPDPEPHGRPSVGQAVDTTAAPARRPPGRAPDRLAGRRRLRFASFLSRLRSGDLGSLPVVIGLVVIWAVFQSQNDAFLSSRNLVNLTLQSAATGTIALGIVLVLLLGEIDLSVGSVSGLSAAILAVGFVEPRLAAARGDRRGHRWRAPSSALSYGALFTRFGVPSFVITLAGLLGFLGLQLKVLGDEGSINIPFESGVVEVRAADLPARRRGLRGRHRSWSRRTSLLRLRSNRRRERGRPVDDPGRRHRRAVGVRSCSLLVVPGLRAQPGPRRLRDVPALRRARRDHGLRHPHDPLGPVGHGGRRQRRGGPPRRHQRQADLHHGLRALLDAGRHRRTARRRPGWRPANQSSGGTDTNLNAIAAAVIGGTSLFGGRGSAYSALLGILVIQSISNGLSLINLGSPERYMITGAVLLLAVIVDSLSRRSRAAHGRA